MAYYEFVGEVNEIQDEEGLQGSRAVGLLKVDRGKFDFTAKWIE